MAALWERRWEAIVTTMDRPNLQPKLTLPRGRAVLACLLAGISVLAADPPAKAEGAPKMEEALYITIDDVGQMAEVERVMIDPLDPNPELSKTDPYVLEEQTFTYESGVSVTASSTHIQWEGESRPIAIMDGDMKTRWSSDYKDGQELKIDLGKLADVAILRVHWEAAAPTEYAVHVSDNGRMWAPVYKLKEGKPGPRVDDIRLTGKTRWIRMELVKRSSEWGFSLWEIETLTAAQVEAEAQAKAAAAAAGKTQLDAPAEQVAK